MTLLVGTSTGTPELIFYGVMLYVFAGIIWYTVKRYTFNYD